MSNTPNICILSIPSSLCFGFCTSLAERIPGTADPIFPQLERNSFRSWMKTGEFVNPTPSCGGWLGLETSHHFAHRRLGRQSSPRQWLRQWRFQIPFHSDPSLTPLKIESH